MNFPTPLKTSTLSLGDVVDISAMQRIQDTFSKAMGFAAVTVDRVGNPVTRDSGFTRICHMIRSTGTGLTRCMQCDAEGGLGAKALSGPYVYQCRGGMLDIAAPIIIQGEYLGSMLCGQVVPSTSREEAIEDVMRCNASLGLPLDDLKEAIQQIPVVPRERVDAAGEMLFQMANYIVEMGVANMTQNRLLEETKERAALQSALQDSQLRMLQSQISPHFLFNALGLISYTALQESARQTEEIAYSLSDLLRYSLRNIATPVTLGQELQIIQHYLSIQKLRFRSRLNVEIEVDPALNDISIPAMILQPLVENAVIHAVEPLARPVTVCVRATPVKNGMLLEVSDDGIGMDMELLDALGTRKFSPNRSALGLRNVVRRLELEYGDRFDLKVESEAGHGTCIRLLIPVPTRRII